MREINRPSLRTSLAGVAIAAFALAGCGGGSGDSDASASPPPSPTAPAPTVAPTVPPAPTATPPPTSTPVPTATPIPVVPVAINQIQVLGSHNSYHLRPEPALFAGITALSAELAESIEYSHAPLTEQLEKFGIRQLELDVFADPAGGLYLNPASNPLVGLPALESPLLAAPGFKVLHTQDFDYASTCLTLVVCLGEIEAWSTANPTHLPIMIMLEFKSESIPDAAAAQGIELAIELPWTTPLVATAELLDALDAEIRSVFDPEQLIQPDDVRGDAPTLEAAVLVNGWPLLEDSRGKVMFSMVNGGEVRDLYVANAPSIEGRPMFTNSTPGDSDAAFMLIDDPADPSLDAAVEAGYLVRTRTDSPTQDARSNDTTRRDLALGSGAQFLSTDYYAPSEFFDSPYVVELPGGVVARCNPVNAPATCMDDQLSE